MTRTVRLPRLLRPISIAAATAAVLLSADALADSLCSGHKLLTKPRPEASCRNVVPEIFVSPDRTLRALVFPSDISLDATPDTRAAGIR
jgi:hypothetical protein